MNESSQHLQDRAALRIARWMVCMHPIKYRQRYEAELDQVLRTLVRFGGADLEKTVGVYLWQFCIPDLFISVVRERFVEWEANMKQHFGKWIGGAVIVLWVLYIGLSLARIFFHLPIKDPGNWLIGDTPANWAYNTLNWFIILGPIAALILMAAPYIHISKGGDAGDLAVIRLHKVAGVSRMLIIVAGLISMVILFIALFGRML